MSFSDSELIKSCCKRFNCTMQDLSTATGIPLATLKQVSAGNRNFTGTKDRRVFLRILSGQGPVHLATTEPGSLLDQLEILKKDP